MSTSPRALPLVTISDAGQFSTHPETIQLLRQQKQNIGVVVVAGLYRTGKSYLLNLLTKAPSGDKEGDKEGEGGSGFRGFAVGSTVNACTKGIWIWSEPIYDEEKNIYVYYLDTEGLGSTSRSETHDSHIFALSLLLSSSFIYNSRGVIDNQALEDLSLVLNITQTIKVKSSSSDKKDGTGENKQETPNSLADHFPSFLWVLRDFSLKLVDDKGKRITSRTYFENCLLPQAGFSEGVEAKNRIRNLITECFRDRDCVALVRPAEDEEILRHLSDHPMSDLRPEFQKQIEHLLAKISKNVRPKTVLGRTINGDMFCSLLDSYVEAMNSGGAPEIKSAWSRVVSNQCAEVKTQALDIYNSEMLSAFQSISGTKKRQPGVALQALLPINPQQLVDSHKKAKAECKKFFRSKLMDPEDDAAKRAAVSLKRELRGHLATLREENRRVSLQVSQAKVQTLMDALAASGGYNFGSKGVSDDAPMPVVHLSDIRSALETFHKSLADIEMVIDQPESSIGSEGKAVVCSKISTDFMDRVMFWASNVSDAFRKSESSLQANIHKLELNLATLTATSEAKQALLTSQMENDGHAVTALKEKIELENTNHLTLMATKKSEIERYESMLSDLGLMHQRAIATLESRIVESRDRLKVARDTVLEEQRKLGEGKSALRAECRNADDARDDEMKQLADSVAQQEAHIATLTRELKDLDKKHREEMNKKSQEQLHQTNELSRNMEKEIGALTAQLNSDARRDKDNKAQEVKRLQDMIKQKENQLIQIGVDPGDSSPVTLSTIKQGATTSNSANKKAQKSKKKQSCQQS